MTKWNGKLSGAGWGAAIGMLGGPVGAMIGAAVGGWIGHQDDTEDEAIEQLANITDSIMAIYAGAVHAKGNIHPKVIKRMLSLMDEIRLQLLPQIEVQEFRGIVESSLAEPVDHETCAQIFASFSDEVQSNVFRGVLSILAADGHIGDCDYNWLSSLVAYAQADPDMLQLNMMFYTRNVNQQDQNAAEAAALLEVSPNCGEAELKRAWRAKAADYHPDKLVVVPAPVRKLAEEHICKVNAAYDILSGKNRKNILKDAVLLSSPSTILDAAMMTNGQIAHCFLCDQKNRIPSADNLADSRCGKCYSLLAIPRDLAEWLLNG